MTRHREPDGGVASFTRRTLLASTGAAALVGSLGLASCATAQPPELAADWLKADAIPLRSIDPLDEDFSDLEPLVRKISDARIVQLGEPSHGAGACFLAKVRLVRFLHQRMGFDVLAWESGFNDVKNLQAGLAAGEDPIAAAKRGILGIWSASEQCRHLFEYAKASRSSQRPLIMAGFDPQFSGPNGFDKLPEELRSFVGAVRDPVLRRDASEAVNDAVDAYAGFSAYVKALASRGAEKPPFPKRDVLEKLQSAVERLVMLFRTRRADFAENGGERRVGFIAHVVANLGGDGANLYEKYSLDNPAGKTPEVVGSNRRDALMAENMRWLVEEGYPQKKFIVWAHNAHVMDAYYLAPDFKNISLAPAPSAMKPLGVHLKERFGDRVYTIGCTTYEGEDAMIANPVVKVPPARNGSLEAELHQLGLAYAVVDLRGLRRGASHPARRPLTARIPKYDEIEVADVTKPYDAILFIDRMTPATLMR